MDINLVRTLVDIMEAGTLSEAARRRGVTRSQISKELKNLEQQVGSTLLRRTTRRLSPTDAGRTLYEHGLRILAETDAALAAIDSQGKTVSGHVRLSIPTGLGEFYLGKLLLEFQQTYPSILLRVLFSNRVVDLVSSEVDIALRITSDPPLDQVARKICNINWGLFAAPSYLALSPPLRQPEELAEVSYLCTPSSERHFKLLLQKATQQCEVRLRPRLQTEHFPYLREATIAGLGISLMPDYSMAEDERMGRVVRVLPNWKVQGLGNSLYILTMKDRHPSHALRVLTDYLHSAVATLNKPS
jgi:DNA-binding transcriptional LysR family regulator